MFFFSLQWRRFLLTRKLLAKAPCWNFPKRGGDAGLLVERGGEREERKGLSPPLSLPFPRYFSPNREPVLPPPPPPPPFPTLSLLFFPKQRAYSQARRYGAGYGKFKNPASVCTMAKHTLLYLIWTTTEFKFWHGMVYLLIRSQFCVLQDILSLKIWFLPSPTRN